MIKLDLRPALSRLVRRFSGATMAAAIAIGAGVAALPKPVEADSFTGAYLAARHAAASRDIVAAARLYDRALRRHPTAVNLLEPAMIFAVAAGDVRKGVNFARRLVRERPESDRIAGLVLAADAIKDGRLVEARERLKITDANGAVALLVDLIGAWTEHGLDDPEAARAALEIESPNTLFKLFKSYHLGLIESAVGDDAKAIEGFEAAIEAAGGATARLARAVGGAYERAGRIEDAEKAYADALERDANEPSLRAEQERMARGAPSTPMAATAAEGAAEAFYGLAAVLAQEEGGRYGLLFAQLALHLRSDFDEGYILIGDIFEDVGQYDAAADAFKAIDGASPFYNLSQLGLASALDRDEREDEALETLRALADSSPDDANVLFAIGEFFSRQKQYDECVDAYDDGVSLIERTVERHWVIYYGRGICLERTGDWDRAEENFTLALELRPDQPDVLNYLGYSLVEQNRRLEEAKDMIERAVAERPQSGYIVDSLGWVLYRMGDFDGAVKYLEEAVRLSPVEPVITDHFGDALWQVGRKMEAKFQWKRALSFEPEEKDLQRIKRKLEVGLDKVLEEEMAAKDGAAPVKVEAIEETGDGKDG